MLEHCFGWIYLSTDYTDFFMNFEISREVIGSAMAVHRKLGYGYLEGVYENALAVELTGRGITFEKQAPLPVYYRGEIVGRYFADMIVEDTLLLELKAISNLTPACLSQLLNYLKASEIHIGLLINFGSNSLQFKRMTTSPLQEQFQKKSV